MSDLTKLTLAEAREGLRAKQFSADRADAGVPRRHRGRQQAAQRLRAGDAGARAGAGQGERRAAGQGRGAAARRAAARHQGPLLHQGRAHDGVLQHPRRLHADLRVDRDAEPVGRRRRHAGQAQLRRVRHGLVERDELLRAGRPIPGGARAPTWRWCRAAPRAARPRRWPPTCASPPPPPTPAARSASPPPSPAPSASSRPTGAARAGASWRSPPRSTRRGRSPRRCAMRPSCCATWRAWTPRTPPASTRRCRTTRRRSARASRA